MSTESDPLNPKNSGDLKNSEDLKNPKNQEKSYNNIPPEIKKYSHHFLIFLVNLLILGLGIINLHYAQYISLNPLLFCFIYASPTITYNYSLSVLVYLANTKRNNVDLLIAYYVIVMLITPMSFIVLEERNF